MTATQVSVTTHLPIAGLYFISRLAESGCLEGVIVQRDLPVPGRFQSIKNLIQHLRCLFARDPSGELAILSNELPGFSKQHLVDARAVTRLAVLARKHRFHLAFTPNINDDAIVHEWLSQARSAWMLVLGGRVLSSRVLESFRGGWLNGHGGILPKYRGLWSEYWALRNGDVDQIGCTIHHLTAKLDRGAVLAQATIEVSPQETLRVLRLRNQANLVRTYCSVVERLIRGDLETAYDADSDSGKGTYYSVPKDLSTSVLDKTTVAEICQCFV
jgi:folate-dependent phosphoribosylglycinamide formyltransferase PurN